MPTFKERYLRELDSWLNDALVFYALTGDDSYLCEKRPGEPCRNLANERWCALDHVFRQTLLDKAWNNYASRTAEIDKRIQRQKEHDKKLVKQFVLEAK